MSVRSGHMDSKVVKWQHTCSCWLMSTPLAAALVLELGRTRMQTFTRLCIVSLMSIYLTNHDAGRQVHWQVSEVQTSVHALSAHTKLTKTQRWCSCCVLLRQLAQAALWSRNGVALPAIFRIMSSSQINSNSSQSPTHSKRYAPERALLVSWTLWILQALPVAVQVSVSSLDTRTWSTMLGPRYTHYRMKENSECE